MKLNNEYVSAAKLMYFDEGTIEIDDEAPISHSPDGKGAYVQAWVWVYDTDVDELTKPAKAG